MNAIRVLYLGLLVMICNLGGFTERPRSTALAQDSQNVTITGVVLDTNNARIVDTIVRIENAEVKRHVKSDGDGSFRIKLPPGEYQITAEHRGFRRFELSPFRVKSGICELVNIHMEVEASRSTLKVN